MHLLPKLDYYKLLQPLQKISFNHLFAKVVLEQQCSGEVYVDRLENPKSFYIIHPYGMSLLFGDSHQAGFNKALYEHLLNKNQSRSKAIWMQVYPTAWELHLKQALGQQLIPAKANKNKLSKGIVEINTRVNFQFNPTKFQQFRASLNLEKQQIIRTTTQIFKEMQGAVIPALFWKDAKDFREKSIGFSVLINNQVASTAFAALIIDQQLEFGIETVETFRGKGLATYAAVALIDYCLKQRLEPVWACSLENVGSNRLAKKLGFEAIRQLPFYRLSD